MFWMSIIHYINTRIFITFATTNFGNKIFIFNYCNSFLTTFIIAIYDTDFEVTVLKEKDFVKIQIVNAHNEEICEISFEENRNIFEFTIQNNL